MAATLSTHCGAVPVREEELYAVLTPEPAGRWFPVPHHQVLSAVKDTLGCAGYAVRTQKLALARGSHRFFGTLDLEAPVAPGVTLAVGIRNSTDKSFPLGFCAGNRVFVCDNLAFNAELLVRRKHTRHGEFNFGNDIAAAVGSLASFREVEGQRVLRFQATELSADRADALILRSYEQGLITTKQLPQVLHEWREPSFEDFRDRTAWSLLNAYTTVLREVAEMNPHHFSKQTMRLNRLLDVSRDADPQFSHAG